MSEHSKILAKYEKMFEDGSAYKPIKLNQPMPNMAEAMGGNNAQVTTEEDLKSEIPLGEQREVFTEDPHTDYSNFDKHMEERINNMRQGNSFSHNNTQNVNEQNGSDRHAKLEKRVAILEKALELVMATQTKMIKEGK